MYTWLLSRRWQEAKRKRREGKGIERCKGQFSKLRQNIVIVCGKRLRRGEEVERVERGEVKNWGKIPPCHSCFGIPFHLPSLLYSLFPLLSICYKKKEERYLGFQKAKVGSKGEWELTAAQFFTSPHSTPLLPLSTFPLPFTPSIPL